MKSQPLIYALIFSLGLIVFEIIVFPQSYELIVLQRYFRNGIYFNFFALFFISLASITATLLLFWAAFSSRFSLRIIYFLLFAFAVFIEYGYFGAFGRYTRLEDTENAFFAADAEIVFNAVKIYFNYIAFLPIAFFALLLFYIKPKPKKDLAVFFSILFLFAALFSVTAFYSSNVFFTTSLGAFSRSTVEFPFAWHVGSSTQPPRNVIFAAGRETIEFHSDKRPARNIIFIVDESIRGDRLSLNGHNRETTPFLDEHNRKGLLRNWGIAVAGTTCSISSNNLLLTGVKDLPDDEYKIFSQPTIFQYARSMNYKTFYFDGQVAHQWLGKRSDIADLDVWIKADEIKSRVTHRYEIDTEIARKIKEIINTSTGSFIWVNKFGVHKPYENSYPAAERQKDDTSAIYDRNLDLETVRDHYDEALRYNSQIFFSELLGDGIAENTVYVYTSDHGQTLGENATRASHCSADKSAANVPLFIIAGQGLLPEVDTGFKASHSNIFATLLDLMNFPESGRKHQYSVSLLKAKSSDSQTRYYFAGGLHGRGSGEKYKFDD